MQRCLVNAAGRSTNHSISGQFEGRSWHWEFFWRGTYFTFLNCFELTDIEKRAIFRGSIDYLITVEHSMDVNYFSSIMESVARDIHCYVLQINTSNFGDSRITLSAETFKRVNVKIKGDDNSSLIIGIIDIAKLSKFQELPVHKQDEHKEKPIKTVLTNFSVRITQA